MTTLRAIVQKLPTSMVKFHGPAQLRTFCCNGRRRPPVPESFRNGRAELPGDAGGSAGRADVLLGGRQCSQTGSERVDDLLAEAMSRPDTLPPQVPGPPAAPRRWPRSATRVRRGMSLLDWCAHLEMMGPFGAVYAQCLRGMAARNPGSTLSLRSELPNGVRIGTGEAHSHAARLAGFAARRII